MHSVGIVLHPRRDCGEAVGAVVDWAAARGGKVFGVPGEIGRVRGATAVSADELAQQDPLIRSGAVTYSLHTWNVNEGRIALTLYLSDQSASLG